MEEITRVDVAPSCQNCDFEYICPHDEPQPCVKWRPDLDYKRLMEMEKKECANREGPYWADGAECPGAEGCAGFAQEVAYG